MAPIPRRLGILAATAAALLLAGCGTRTSAAPGEAVPTVRASAVVPPGPSTGAPPAPCPESGLRISGDADADGAMGLRAYGVYATNCSGVPRTLEGYPQIHVLDEKHDRVPATAHHGMSVTHAVRDAGPHRVTLKPGARARFTMAWRNLVTSGTVVATTGRYLEVAAPAAAPPQLVTIMVDLGNTTRFDVTAWEPDPGAVRAPVPGDLPCGYAAATPAGDGVACPARPTAAERPPGPSGRH